MPRSVMASASKNGAAQDPKVDVVPVAELTNLCEKALSTLGYDAQEAKIKTEVRR